MTREEQIEEQIKQQMLLIQQKMDRLAAWKQSGYGEPCVHHHWKLVNYELWEDAPYTLYFACDQCGMTMTQKAKVIEETIFDEWQEYRENKGDEEE